ncbi:MAG: 2-oxoglutarate dehydrogenase E1 component, partial [Gammaproteobacteria bacterium]|nr:2-oxoglutarate dehydrogenase E1 component [Gammaproteobacteria bacterium]
EADDPMVTQPLLYQTIKKTPTTRKRYADQLINEGVVSKETVKAWADDYRDSLDAGKAVVELSKISHQHSEADWTPYLKQDLSAVVDTSVTRKQLDNLGEKLTTIPENFKLQPQVNKLMQDRRSMMLGEHPIDWGYAETMAYATLAAEKHGVRLSGQDSQRGTFAHRHAVLHDVNTSARYMPLNNLSDDQATVDIINSTLSEEAVMGYECGYSSTLPEDLVIWEGQFGDFANGAQVIIDQFISSGEQKWGRIAGFTLFLPHGYEGQGPEHSSARLERYLQLCAQRNMQVCIPTTPAQMFHLLRRQILRPARKPLIVMTPKSLLRHKLAISTLEDLSSGKFQLVIPECVTEIADSKASQVTRVVLCSGKVYYDLLHARQHAQLTHVVIIRIEQLYPFPVEELVEQLQRYSKAKNIVWCQEEPMNQGAWYSMQHNMRAALAKHQQLHYAGRQSSAAPVAGSVEVFSKCQAALIQQALDV